MSGPIGQSRRVVRHATAVALAILCAGCASVSSFRGLPLGDDGTYLRGLPPLTQDGHYACGATCVAAVAASLDVSPAKFRETHPALPGDLTAQQLTALVEPLGLQAFAYAGSIDDLAQNLRRGRFLIVMIPRPLPPRGGLVTEVLLSTWNAVGPRPAHWIVVVGMTARGDIIVHDPASGPLTLRAASFESWWARCDHLSVLIVPRAPGPAADDRRARGPVSHEDALPAKADAFTGTT